VLFAIATLFETRPGVRGQLSVKLSVKVVKELDEVLAELRWIVLEKKRVRNIFTLAEFSGLSDSGPRLQFFRMAKNCGERSRTTQSSDFGTPKEKRPL